MVLQVDSHLLHPIKCRDHGLQPLSCINKCAGCSIQINQPLTHPLTINTTLQLPRLVLQPIQLTPKGMLLLLG
jgi:hypothetical protein